jgi:ABC-2 type transport system ATP-binding protein
MATTALSVSGLTKRYGGRTVVDALDLELPMGVAAGFIGPNGAGKTTTMAMLLGLVRPSSGTGTVLGASIDDPAMYLRRVGALIETPAFYPSLTGEQNLRMFATVGRFPHPDIPRLLEQVGLDGRGGDAYRRYSLGMKQRLGIAAALLGDPELLVLDEPSNGLDPQGVREMRTLIGELADGGRTILVSSHDLSELEQVCDWLVLIEGGRSVHQGATRAFIDDAGASLEAVPHHGDDLAALHRLVTDRGMSARRDGDRLVIDVGAEALGQLAADLNRAAFDAGIVLVELRPTRTSLEERYLTLVGDRAHTDTTRGDHR